MISCISQNSSHFFYCQGLSNVNWWQPTSRLTNSQRNIPVIECVCIHACARACVTYPCVCICFLPFAVVFKSVIKPLLQKVLLSPPSNRENGTSLITRTKDTWVCQPLSHTLIFVTARFAVHLFNCLSLTRTHRHSGGLSNSASSSLPLKWNDLISQLSILKDIYKTHYATNAGLW